jgi:hypothetical protein
MPKKRNPTPKESLQTTSALGTKRLGLDPRKLGLHDNDSFESYRIDQMTAIPPSLMFFTVAVKDWSNF